MPRPQRGPCALFPNPSRDHKLEGARNRDVPQHRLGTQTQQRLFDCTKYIRQEI